MKTNNYELGWRGALGDQTRASLALFYTTSDLGDVQSFNNGLILSRTQERIYGVEGSVDWLSLDDVWGVGSTLTWMRGREKPDNGDWRDMTGFRVPPLKLTAYLQYQPNADWSNRLQATYIGSQDYRLDGQASFGRREVHSYSTLDLISDYRLSDADKLSLGIQNLLNRDYYPLYSQLMRSSNTSHRCKAQGCCTHHVQQVRAANPTPRQGACNSQQQPVAAQADAGRQGIGVIQQPGIEAMAYMGQHALPWLQLINNLQRASQVVVIARGDGLRRGGAIQHQQIQRLLAQHLGAAVRHAEGVCQVGDTPTVALQQVAKGQLGMIKRQRRDAQLTQLPPLKRRKRLAEIENTGVLVQVGQAFWIIRAMHRNNRPLTPAQVQQALAWSAW